ncbi:MAG: hypothetical protein EZS28_022182 [Streblomastix strix]|uniref:Uncharacterized protein n=1 Tax=Streblomastix strix TaxID=222440 RepID=A0A5J4VI71_9EUKA|nr:MAG: hypothetical protein EZS28_022182 [Streblomastix strix]
MKLKRNFGSRAERFTPANVVGDSNFVRVIGTMSASYRHTLAYRLCYHQNKLIVDTNFVGGTAIGDRVNSVAIDAS